MLRRILFLFLILSSLFALLFPLAKPGVPITHDGENHLARFANYAAALRQGQLPPRWAPNLAGGYGYPVFNYAYPLANILSMPLQAIRIPLEIGYKFQLVLAVCIGALGTYLWLRYSLGRSRFGSGLGVVSLLTFPYLWHNIYVRGNIGEVWGWSLLPGVLFFSWRWLMETKKSVRTLLFLMASIVAWSLSHTIVVAFSVPLVLLWTLYWWRRSTQSWQNMLPLATSFGLAAFYWIPAILEKNMVVLSNAAVSSMAALHVVSLRSLFFDPHKIGYSFVSPVDTLGFGVGIAAVVCLALGLIIGVVDRKRFILSISLVILLLLLLCSPILSFVWNIASLGSYIQFPWRLLGLVQLCVPVLIGLVYDFVPSKLKLLVFISVLFTVRQLFLAPIPGWKTQAEEYYRLFTQTTTIQDEYRPTTLVSWPTQLSPQQPSSLMENSSVRVKQWNGSRHLYTVRTKVDDIIVEPTAYFPGWQVQVNGQITKIDPTLAGGLIAYRIAPGEHTVQTAFSAQTPARIVGNSITLVSTLVFFVLIKKVRRDRV